jgi:putative membrane protein
MYQGWSHPSWMAYDGWHWGMGLHGLFWLIVIGLAIVLVVVLVRQFGRGEAPPRLKRSALDIVEERYARGEIDREEYLQKKKDLG